MTKKDLSLLLCPSLLSTRQRIPVTRANIVSKFALSRFLSSNMAAIYVAKMLRRVTYTLCNCKNHYIIFFIGIACRRFFLFFHLVRNISESESASFFCYFFRARPQQRAHVVPCLLPRRKRDNRAKIDGGWSKRGEGNSESTMGWNYAYERWWTKVFDPIRNLISKRWVSKGFADFILTRKYGVLSVMDRVIFLSRQFILPD